MYRLKTSSKALQVYKNIFCYLFSRLKDLRYCYKELSLKKYDFLLLNSKLYYKLFIFFFNRFDKRTINFSMFIFLFSRGPELRCFLHCLVNDASILHSCCLMYRGFNRSAESQGSLSLQIRASAKSYNALPAKAK